MDKTLAGTIIGILEKAGCESVFTIPGSLMFILEHFDQHPKFRLFTATHEEHLGFMAMGSYRITRRIPVVLVTQGPGATNLVNSVASAWRDHCPMVIVTAYNSLHESIKFQDTHGEGHTPEIKRIFEPITQAQFRINPYNGIETLPLLIRQLDEIASPILVELDKIKTSSKFDSLKAISKAIKSRFSEIKKVIEDIDPRKKPVFLIGQGAKNIPAELLIPLLQKTNALITTTLGAIDMIPPDCHNLLGNIGRLGKPAANNYLSDTCQQLIVIGSSLSGHTLNKWFNAFCDRNGEIININYEKAILPQKVKVKNIRLDFKKCHVPQSGPIHRTPIPSPSHPFIKIINELIPQKVLSVEAFRESIFAEALIQEGDTLLTSASHGSLGCSLPMACGSALSSHLAHIVICGDGGFLFTCTSLLTLKRYNLYVLVLVIINNEFKTVADSQRKRIGKTICTKLTLPNLNLIGATFGIYSNECNTYTELRSLVEWFSKNQKPAIGFLHDNLI